MLRASCGRVVVGCVVLAAASGALAQDVAGPERPGRNGIELAVTVGPLFSGGDGATPGPFLATELTLGYRFGILVAGATGTFGRSSDTFFGSDFVSRVDAAERRLGLFVALSPFAGERVQPWVGLGVGHDWFGGEKRWEVGRISAGVDFALGRWIRVGPTVSFAALVTESGGDYRSFTSVGLRVTALP